MCNQRRNTIRDGLRQRKTKTKKINDRILSIMSINARFTLLHPSQLRIIQSKPFRVISSVYVFHILHEQHAALAASYFTLHFHCKFQRHQLFNCIHYISFYACVGFIHFLFKIPKRDCF